MASDEFKGVETYCQDFVCSFQLGTTHKKGDNKSYYVTSNVFILIP